MSVIDSRKPYVVQYRDFHTGALVTVKRRPPPKVHQMLPNDVVTLSTKSGEGWEEGGEYTVKSISPRQPNVLQIENSKGETTFVPYNELTSDAVRGVSNPVKANRYLRWP